MNQLFQSSQISVAITNSYFDYSDYEVTDLGAQHPTWDKGEVGVIKQYIDDRFFIEMEENKWKKANIFVMQSVAELQDDYLLLGQQREQDFVEIENIYFYDDQYDPKEGLIGTVYFRFDSHYNVYSRRIYSIMDLLGDIGGMYSSIYFIGYIMIFFFQHRMFISAILKQLY